MQPLYPNRINFENFPSINTPLGESTLNKIDYAVYGLDQRVLALYGYEGRVAQSEKNAKESEVNAKTSETNAKQSELKAKEYMENAFSGTPEGYEKLVEDVRLMDIQTTTDTTLPNSKAGGYKLLSMSGNSVQNGTPSTDAKQSIHNVGDCVEIEIGGFSSAGVPTSATKVFRNKRRVSCNTTGIITLKFPYPMYSTMYFFDANGNEIGTYAYPGLTLKHSMTIPNGSTGFDFACGGVETIDFATLGKIELTINGKYVVQIVEHGKNFLNCSGLVATTTNGITFTPSYNSKGELEYINVNGTATADTWYNTPNSTYLPNGNYVVTTNSPYSTSTHVGYVVNSSNATIGAEWKENGLFTLSEDTMVKFTIYVKSGITVSNAKYYPMIRKADIEDATYEPYKEKVATVLLEKPLCETDVMSRTEVARKKKTITLNGTEGITWYMRSDNAKHVYASPNSLWSDHDATISDGDLLSNRFVGNNSIAEGHIWFSSNYLNFVANVEFTSSDEVNTWLANNPIELEYELAEEVIEELDADSQIALNRLETFDTVTYINVDSRVQPSEIKGEYGTSMVGAYTLKSLLNSESNTIRYNELAVALVATESGV